MKYTLSLLLLSFTSFLALAQVEDFPKITYQELSQESYDIDSTANAVVLLEKGNTHILSSDADQAYMVYHTYKVRIKILNTDGYDQANFSIPLYKFGNKFEYIQDIKGITHNIENFKITSIELENKNKFLENKSEYLKLSKFTLPNVKVGSIIDIEYTIVSPDIFNFRSWNFQNTIPKLKSVYAVNIPAVYNYNVTLKGGLELSDTKSRIDKQCLSIYNTRVDCSNIIYTMENIPAFKEEAYMLAAKNYISAINFELVEVNLPDGSRQTFTKNWKDVDRELLNEKSFGGQIKKTKDLIELLDPNILTIADPYQRAMQVYYWIQKNIKWNYVYGKYSQSGIEDALKNKLGNTADINLALLTAMNAANLEAFPILVSTRENGLPNSLHPVITDFNYVIVGVKIDDEIIQLDATDRLLPFGQLPLRAVNGNGRIIYNKKSSDWIPISNSIISSTHYKFDGKMDANGVIKGQLSISKNGLEAYNKRREIQEIASIQEYQEKLDEKLTSIDIDKFDVHGLDDVSRILLFDLDITLNTEQNPQQGNLFINPIFIDRTQKNPFNLDERNYPVDLGSNYSEIYEINIEMPKDIELVNSPKNISLSLPESSAKYLYKSEYKDNTLSVIQQLSLNKPIYYTEEYFGLKELFSRIIQQQKIDFSFKKASK